MATSSMESSGALLALSNNLAEIVEQTGRSVVAVNARRRRSSSAVYWRSGILVTAEHTINREDDISIILPDNQTTRATLVGRDPGTDLAVLRLNDPNLASLTPATLGEATELKVGNMVLAIARSQDSGVSASMGVISALSGSWRSWHGGRIDQLIRPSLMLYPGFSGGALVNTAGQIVGINTVGPRHSALTLPTSTVNRVVDQLLQGGRISRGYLGVGMQPVRLPEALGRSLHLSQTSGVIVVSVEPDSPAERAGILIGDILVALGSTPINDVGDVLAMLDPENVGNPLAVRLIRAGSLVELTLTVGERPSQEV